uniref:Uncharacterized protein n=1 Tax=Cucumis melo TaxID=3656 RepID=A0A9I9E5T2_CUCME
MRLDLDVAYMNSYTTLQTLPQKDDALDATPVQVALPPKFKHIIKQRKRNLQCHTPSRTSASLDRKTA